MKRTPAAEASRTCSVGLLGHPSCGKTQLAEILLHAAGVVRQPGAVDAGTSLLDAHADAIARHHTVWPAWAWLPWGETVVHLLDTPGGDHGCYTSRLAIAGVDLQLLVVAAPDGIERGAEDALRTGRHVDAALGAVITKVDRPGAIAPIVARMEEVARRRAVLLQLPVHEDGVLVGLVDLLADRVLRYDPEGSGAWSPEPVPSPMRDAVDAARERLVEAIAVTDDALLETYLEHLELPADAAWDGLARAVRDGELLPVFLASGTANVGAAALLDGLVRLAPDPTTWRRPADAEAGATFVAQWVTTHLDAEDALVTGVRIWSGEVRDNQVWRNCRTGETVRVHKLYQLRGPRRSKARYTGTGDVVAVWDGLPGRPGDAFTDGPVVPLEPPPPRPTMAWVHLDVAAPSKAADLDAALARAVVLDPSVQVTEVERPPGRVLAAGCRRQLDEVLTSLRVRHGLRLVVGPRPVGYLEVPARAAHRAHGRHLRLASDGEVAEFGEVWLDTAPTGDLGALRWAATVDDDDLPARFLPGVQRGVERALQAGPLAGYPVCGVSVACVEGAYDALESTDAHLEIAGHAAMVAALTAGGTELWEPWSDVHLFVPTADVGAALAELGAHRARVLGVQVDDEETSVQVSCPDRELPALALRLEALTRARAWFLVRPTHHDRLPNSLVAEVVARSPFLHLRPEGAHVS
ncbi:MAG: hypothetical protein H6733_08980 [Alphaproteobacteria bacterium]|nr:hypothetical protein [Alphaproteobacteria bacterium]